MRIEDAIKQRKFDNIWIKALVNLHYTSNFYSDLLLAILKPYRINDQHYNVLRILKGQHPQAVCPGYIKSVLLNKRGDLTRLVDKLCQKGYVARATNPTNRRMVDLNITEAGLQLLQNLHTKIDTFEQLKHKLTIEEASLLNELLDKLSE